MQVKGKVVTTVFNDFEGQRYWSLCLLEADGRFPTVMKTAAEIRDEVSALRWSDEIIGEVEMSTYNGKSSLRLLSLVHTNPLATADPAKPNKDKAA